VKTSCEKEEAAMYWEQIKGRWKRIRRIFKREDSNNLIDEEFVIIAKKRDQLVNVLRETCRRKKEEAEKEFKWFTDRIAATQRPN